MLDEMNDLKSRLDYHAYLTQGGNLEYEQWRDEQCRFQPIYISSPSWEEPGPTYPTREQAKEWLDRQCRRAGDWGYIVDLKA